MTQRCGGCIIIVIDINSKEQHDSNQWPARMHYARLSSVLSHIITIIDLLAICTELNVSLANLKLSPNSSQTELVQVLTTYLFEDGRFEELFDVLNKRHPQIVQDWLQKRPSETWLSSVDIPEHIILQVDNLLGEKGVPHFGYEFYDEPTGCYCWSFVSAITEGEFPNLKYKVIERLRLHLKNELVIAFIGQQSFYDIPQIIIAPTTDQLDIVRIAGTCGPTLGLDCENILDELQVINEQYDIDIIGADDRALILKLKHQIQGTKRDELIRWLDIFADDAIWTVGFSDQEYIELIFD